VGARVVVGGVSVGLVLSGIVFGDCFLCSGNVVFVCPEELPGILVGGVHGVWSLP
jgi:hypothetical protein